MIFVLQGSGIKVGDTKYMFLKVQDEGATKMVMGKRSGKGGITIGNTNQGKGASYHPQPQDSTADCQHRPT